MQLEMVAYASTLICLLRPRAKIPLLHDKVRRCGRTALTQKIEIQL